MTLEPVVLLTGAGKGIGRAIVEELCDRSAAVKGFKPKLVLVTRSAGDLPALRDLCRSRGLACEAIAGDISKPADIDRAVAAAISAFGAIDCLINNAGTGRFGDLLQLSEDDLNYVFDTNLKGTFLLTQKVFAGMQARRSGHIIFVTSISAEKAFEHSAIYCMSKFGQKGLVEVLRLHAQKANVRVTNVLPGAAYTPMWGEQPREKVERMMAPRDVAQIIVDSMLVNPRASVDEIVIRPVAGDP